MANHASREFVRPFPSETPQKPCGPSVRRGSDWFARALLASTLAVFLAGAASLAWSAPAAAAVPNLAPGNAEIDIDDFWRETLSVAGIDYSSPAVVPFSDIIATTCGTVAPSEYIAFYCLPDSAVYWSTPAFDQASLAAGDAAWVNVMAHEWSHHVQFLLGVNTDWRQYNDLASLELEATCMGGVYIASARDRKLVTDDMITAMIGMFVGNATHGTTEQVQNAFLGGLNSGIGACGLELPTAASLPATAASTVAIPQTTSATSSQTADTGAPGTIAHVTAPGVNLRATPSTSAPVLAVLSPTTNLEITGPAQSAGGHTWWPVTDPTTDQSGYVAATFLSI